MNKLFNDSDSDNDNVSFETNSEYAKKYDAWREKEELHKLEQKYGDKALKSDNENSSDSEDEDEEPVEMSDEMDKAFLKTLSLLKNKDPRIYDPSYKFFDELTEEKNSESNETEINKVKPKKEVNSLAAAFANSDSEDENVEIFKVEKQAPENRSKEDGIKEYLIGRKNDADNNIDEDLAPLKALWSDPKLNEDEAFLRDYILNKGYLEAGDAETDNEKLLDFETLEMDEERIEEQGKFERAYNFRFEEPDQEYLKRYPRTMNYIRPKDDRRARKRAEVRARKEEEKKKKMEEIARLKALKLKEIQEKIAKIKEVTGNQDLAFKEEDIEGDFDPEEHDRRMKAIFDQEYYDENPDTEKPVFPDLDEELEIENWESYENEHINDLPKNSNTDEGLHCEDEDFNMDADYDPNESRKNLMDEIKETLGKKRRNRKKKSKLAEILAAEKPKYVPEETRKTYSEYMDEYYKMDCEDVIGGDLPTRFKYREVVPNSFGLTIEEILLADDRDLNKWASLKKTVKYRPDHVEKGEVKTYLQKANDVELKKKILPSLFKDVPEEPELVVPIETKKKKKKKKNDKDKEETVEDKLPKIKNKNGVNEKLENNNSLYNGDEDQFAKTKNKDRNKKLHVNKKLQNSNSLYNIPEYKFTKVENIHKEDLKNNDSLDDRTEETPLEKNKKRKKTCNVQIPDNTSEEMTSGLEEQIHNFKKKKRKFNQEAEKKTNNLTRETQVSNMENVNETIMLPESKKKPKHKLLGNEGFVTKKKKRVDENQSKVCNLAKKKKNKNNKLNFKSIHKSKESFNNTNENPLSKLSDERLKAYGLNPKKYRSFLRYKKF